MDHPAAIFLGCSLVFYVKSNRKQKYILCLIPIIFSLIQFKIGLSPFVYIIILLIFLDQTVIFYAGKNREIKRIFNHFNIMVDNLHRYEFAGIKLGKLAEGKYRKVNFKKFEKKLLLWLYFSI